MDFESIQCSLITTVFTVVRDAPASNFFKKSQISLLPGMHLHQNLKNHRFHCCQGCTYIKILKIADFTVVRMHLHQNFKNRRFHCCQGCTCIKILKIADFTVARMHLHQNFKNHRFHCCQDAPASKFKESQISQLSGMHLHQNFKNHKFFRHDDIKTFYMIHLPTKIIWWLVR